MSPARAAEMDRRAARWVFGILCGITAIIFLAGETGLAGMLALLLLSSAISQIPPRKEPERKPRRNAPEEPPKGLMRSPKFTPEQAERLTGAPAIACGIAALFLVMTCVGLLVG